MFSRIIIETGPSGRSRCSAASLLVLALTVATFTPMSWSQVVLPLAGNYRPGRLFPVVFPSPHYDPVRIRGDGIVPTDVATGTRVAYVMPLGDGVNKLRITGFPNGPIELPLHALEEGQRLVGIVGRDVAPTSLQAVFPDQSIITLPLEQIDGCLDSLDAVVIEADDALALQILSAGVAVVVRGATPPPGQALPYQRVGDFYVIRPQVAGPTGAIDGETTYLPVAGWRPDFPSTTRRRVVLAGVIVSLAGMAILLARRSRTQLLLIATVGIAATISVEIWRRQRPNFDQASGSIEIFDDNGLVQRDHWRYFVAGPAPAPLHLRDGRPILANLFHASKINLKLTCDPQGIEWTCTLPPRASVAILDRTYIADRLPQDLQTPVSSTFQDLARLRYLRQGQEIKGHQISPSDTWPSIIIAPE